MLFDVTTFSGSKTLYKKRRAYHVASLAFAVGAQLSFIRPLSAVQILATNRTLYKTLGLSEDLAIHDIDMHRHVSQMM